MILTGHCIEVLRTLPAAWVQAAITSPPYWGLRDYGTAPVTWGDGRTGEIGQEPTPDAFVGHLMDVFRAVRRILRPDGLLWVNLGDTCETGHVANPSPKSTRLGSKDVGAGDDPVARTGTKGGRQKSLAGIPHRFAVAMMSDGWIFRQDVIWAKPSRMPESVTDRFTKAHECVFLLARQPRYFWDPSAIQERAMHAGAVMKPFGPGSKDGHSMATGVGHTRGGGLGLVPNGHVTGEYRNRRSVWTVANDGVTQAHFATFPRALARPMIRASTKVGDTVLDPFSGAGTTVLVAGEQGRIGIGIEINPSCVAIRERCIPLRLDLDANPGEAVRDASALPMHPFRNGVAPALADSDPRPGKWSG